MKAVLLEVEDDSDVSQLLDHIVDLLCHEVCAITAWAISKLELVLGIDSYEADRHRSEALVVDHYRERHTQSVRLRLKGSAEHDCIVDHIPRQQLSRELLVKLTLDALALQERAVLDRVVSLVLPSKIVVFSPTHNRLLNLT